MNQRKIEANFSQKIPHRLKYNPCLLKFLIKLKNTEQIPRYFPEYMGERNFFDWDEVYQFQIGKWANIFY